jgi:cytoskeletal protein CcmA (bactofilin family)
MQDDGNITLSTKNARIAAALSNNEFAVKAGDDTSLTMADAGRIVLKVGDITLTITKESIVIDGNPKITINAGDVEVKAENVNLEASDSVNITAPVTNFHGNVNFDEGIRLKATSTCREL